MEVDPCATSIAEWIPVLLVLWAVVTLGVVMTLLVRKASRASIEETGPSAARWVAVGLGIAVVFGTAYLGWAIITATLASRAIDGC